MSVSEGHTLAALMPIATIPKGLTTVHVNLDSLGVEENARVSITLRILSKGSRFSNLELSDKQNLRLPYQEQYVKKTYPFIVVFTVVGASIYIFFNDNLFLVICVFFVQTSTNVFVGYTNAALMHFATIPEGLTTVHVNLDSLEMDKNVKVNVGVEM